MELLGIQPNRPQKALINAINNPKYRFVTACLSRRVGKTYISNIIGQLVALYPGTHMLLIAPDYSLASISWDLQRQLLGKFDIEKTKDNAKDRVIELTNGSMIRVASVARVDSAVGRSYDLIIFDEAALNDEGEKAFNVALRPTLDKMESKCIFISTPRGDNWFREFFDRGFNDKEEYSDWVSIHADWRENPRATAEDIRRAKATMSNAEFEQEYLANFVTFEGQIWGLPDEAIQDLTPVKNLVLEYPHRFDKIAGLDMGFRDFTALAVIAVEDILEGEMAGLKRYFILEEYFEHKKSTEAHAHAIHKLEQKWDIDYIFIDSAAAQTRFDLASTYEIATINAKKSVPDGIGAVGAVLQSGRLIVDENCFEVIHSMRNYKWKGQSNDGVWNIETQKPEHNRASHMADAIRYAIYTYEQGAGGVM